MMPKYVKAKEFNPLGACVRRVGTLTLFVGADDRCVLNDYSQSCRDAKSGYYGLYSYRY